MICDIPCSVSDCPRRLVESEPSWLQQCGETRIPARTYTCPGCPREVKRWNAVEGARWERTP